MPDMVTREEMADIYHRALQLADTTPVSCWKRAYENLAFAADTLDAMLARTEVHEAPSPELIPINEG